jgi:hypothetical protein
MQTKMETKMQNKTQLLRAAVASLAAVCALTITGCGVATPRSSAVAGIAMQGRVFGGQQPISGSTIQLYAAGQTGYGQSATALIAANVTTDTNGNFSITGDYTCPYASTQVYLTSTGGNSGSGSNTNVALMAALGSCGNLSGSTNVTVNELTTVAAAYALAPFMTSPTQLSTTPTNVTGLVNAFATVNKLVNVSTGQLPGSTLPTGATEPSALLNTLADILASCINTNGVGGSSTNCATLFTNTTLSGGSTPSDTITAALNIAKNPGSNVTNLFPLMTPSAPFLPTLSAAPSAFTVSIRYAPTGTFSTPSASAVDASGNVWVTNSGNNTIAVVGATTGTPTIYSSGSLNAPSGIAFDATGNAWVPNKGNSTLSAFTPAGTGSVALTSNLSAPTAVAVDSQGLIWVANSGNGQITAATASGVSVTGSATYPTGGTNPAAVAINTH